MAEYGRKRVLALLAKALQDMDGACNATELSYRQGYWQGICDAGKKGGLIDERDITRTHQFLNEPKTPEEA